MPSKKILGVLIVCVGIVGAIWIFERQFSGPAGNNPSVKAISNEPRQNLDENSDWKKILSANVDVGTTTIVGGTTYKTYSGEGTVTDQLAKDFFSLYLSAQKDANGNLTDEQVMQIAENTLTNQSYTKVSGAVYTSANLRVAGNSDRKTVEGYYNAMIDLENLLLGINKSAFGIVDKAVVSQKQKDLEQLDPIIGIYKTAIGKLLAMTVPQDAVSIHLNTLNSISNMLSCIEAMRQTFVDPVKSFAAINQYSVYSAGFSGSIKDAVAYFTAKGFGPPEL